MINQRIWIWLLLISVLLTGCRDQRILEETGFIQSMSYDRSSDGNIKTTISVPIANPEIKASREVLKTEAKGSKEARIMLSKQTNLLLVSGQLRSALFGLSLARKGIWEHMDTLTRDPTIGERVNIVIVNGDAGNLLEKDYKEYPRTGKYIDSLLQKEAKGQSIPNTTLYSFTRDYYDDGIDPVAPMIKDAGESVIVDGIALFKDDKVVGKIDSKDSLIFSFLKGNLKQGELSLDLTEETQESQAVMLSSLSSKKKVDVKYDNNGKLEMSIHVRVKASVLEYIGDLKLSNDADRHKLEQEISTIVTERAERIVKSIQEKKADSLGMGTYVRNGMSYNSWKKLNWHEQYPDVPIQCQVKINITDYGFRR